MNNAVAVRPAPAVDIMESVLIKGDLARLTPEERSAYYIKVCESVGLNPLTKPFEYITLNGKLTLYALRACTDQLRSIYNVSVEELTESERDGVFVVTAKVRNGEGRTDMSKGALQISGLKGEALANALMKAETKAKRRATLSICGLGFLDEMEIETIPNALPTLPKKDARGIAERLNAEFEMAQTVDGLKAWMIAAKDRIEVMPEDWQNILRGRCKERLADFRMRESVTTAFSTDVPPVSDAPPFDWPAWTDNILAQAQTADDLEAAWQSQIMPALAQMPDVVQEDVFGVGKKHEARFAP